MMPTTTDDREKARNENKEEEPPPTVPPRAAFRSRRPEEAAATGDQEIWRWGRRGDRGTKREGEARDGAEAEERARRKAALFRADRTVVGAVDLREERQRRNAMAAWVLATLARKKGDVVEGDEESPTENPTADELSAAGTLLDLHEQKGWSFV